MGNIMSEDEAEKEFLGDDFDFESPEADKQINFGTAAPSCQPHHTQQELKTAAEGQEVVMDDPDSTRPEHLQDGQSRPLSAKHRRGSNLSESSSEPQNKKQHMQQTNSQKKMSYIQMAKMGYQELVNAIIRPPRAEYKMEALGPPAFNFCGKRFTRTDFTLRTKRGYNVSAETFFALLHGDCVALIWLTPSFSPIHSLNARIGNPWSAPRIAYRW